MSQLAAAEATKVSLGSLRSRQVSTDQRGSAHCVPADRDAADRDRERDVLGRFFALGPDDLALLETWRYLSAIMWEHVELVGDCSFDQHPPADRLRPLQSQEA